MLKSISHLSDEHQWTVNTLTQRPEGHMCQLSGKTGGKSWRSDTTEGAEGGWSTGSCEVRQKMENLTEMVSESLEVSQKFKGTKNKTVSG